MESLSSSFLHTHPHLLNAASLRSNSKRPSQAMIIITANSSFTKFHLLKKLKLQNTAQAIFQTLKNPPLPKLEVLIQMIKNKQHYSKLLPTIFNAFDDFISAFIDSPLRPCIDPKHVLSENFAPVGELPPTACDEAAMEGSLPSCLDGAYIRNGPNPQFNPQGQPYHFLDGDGMLHVIKISKGRATFCSRYVKTHKYIVEREIGRPIIPNFFAIFMINGGLAASAARFALAAARALTGQFDPLNCGFGVANTSLALFCGQLFALCESDLPYALKVTQDGDVITLGRCDFNAKVPFLWMTAHPKVDSMTGEVFAHRYNMMRPFLTFFRIDSKGRKQSDVPIYSIERFTAVHDLAVTKNYAIIPDIQMVVEPLWILRGRSPLGVDAAKIPRLGILPRYAEDDGEMRWVDAAGFNMLHCVNAWEEDGGATVCMVATNVVAVERVLESVDHAQLTLEKVTIDVEGKRLQRQPVASGKYCLDFGVINPAYAAKKNRYVYAAVIGPTAALGVVKLDLSLTKEDGRDCTVASRLFGPGCYGGEPFFVARDPNNPTAEEDDGYLVTYMHDENTQESKFLVMDAKSPTLDIVAAVKLPQRVPNGFHGLFVSESDLNKM